MKKSKKIKIIAGGAVLIIVGLLIMHSCNKNGQSVSFETGKVTKGSISNTVTATGTLQAILTVDVGTQVSGVIQKLYVDFNSNVKKGQLLAELDKTPLLASVEDAKASLANAQAEVDFQTANYNRVKTLFDKSLVAQTDFDQATYNINMANANLKAAKVKFDKAKINLDYATICSPIDGVILNRAVNEGQTVAASFNTPTLFSIANDLTQMQVEANIDEADIGQVKKGQLVEFTVDAFPDMKFKGEVTEIRLQPVTTSNVVTYTVIINAPNPDKKLMPGLTANISIVIEKSDNTLIVSSKALRFKPDNDVLNLYFASLSEKDKPTPPQQGAPVAPPKIFTASDSENVVWVKKGSDIHPVPVETGVNDGINIEVKKGLSENDEVIYTMTSNVAIASTTSTSKSPFMPTPPKRK